MGETLRSTEKLRSSGPPVSGRRVRNDPRRRGAGIEDEPQPVLEVQLTRLGRNVGSRIVQSQIRLERRFFRLSVHRAVPIFVEPIEHDPFEPGHSPHLLDDDVGELGQRAHALHPHQRRPERVVHRHRFWRLWIRLELEDRRALVAVEDPVESLPVRTDAQRVRLVPALLAQRLPHARRPTRDQ